MSATKLHKSQSAQFGFTLIELLVVISIMGILLGLLTVNFAGQRTSRNLKIAQNQLITDLRGIQSNTLSARSLPNGQPPSFYLIKFDFTQPTQYTIQAIYNISTAPKLITIRTVTLPQGIILASATSPVTITSSVGTQNPTSCAVVAFKTPFAKAYLAGFNLSGNCNIASSSGAISSSDNYVNIINFVTNTVNYPVTSDSTAVIRLTDTNNTLSGKVLIKGIIGLICPTKDESNCSP